MSESDNNSQQSAESLLSDELFLYCNSDSLSKEGLHEIIEQRQNHDVSDYEFFLAACCNEEVTEKIIRCLLEYFPAAISDADDNYDGHLPLHAACGHNKNMTPDIIQLLIDAAPDAIRSVDSDGRLPLHWLCRNNELDETAALGILKLLKEKHPEAIRHADNEGCLPILLAGGQGRRSTEFCGNLIEAYPGSERVTDVSGVFPLNYACLQNTVATVEYLYKLYPDAINFATATGGYPIHLAIMSVDHRDKPLAAVDIVKFLLDCDPIVKLQKYEGYGLASLLYFACRCEYNDSTIAAALEIIKVIYDAYPEAIEEDIIASNIQSYPQQVQAFINSQLVYSRQANDHRLMTTPDDSGQLPLHRALQSNVRLGSIKLLVKGNPSAIRNADTNFAMSLHIACQHHESADVIQYLIGLDTTTLDAVDKEGDTALHIACRSAKYDNIALLLEMYDAVSVSKWNAHGKRPINLLWESNLVEDRGSVEYTESVFRLLKACPEMVMTTDMQLQSDSGAYPSQNRKKRKFDC
eukprot:scaffold15883_cov155-Skeletonema_dohrnii-CCMP3373.AAC.1